MDRLFTSKKFYSVFTFVDLFLIRPKGRPDCFKFCWLWFLAEWNFLYRNLLLLFLDLLLLAALFSRLWLEMTLIFNEVQQTYSAKGQLIMKILVCLTYHLLHTSSLPAYLGWDYSGHQLHISIWPVSPTGLSQFRPNHHQSRGILWYNYLYQGPTQIWKLDPSYQPILRFRQICPFSIK